MSRERSFKCTSISPGSASGPALVSNEAVCFYLVKPETGIVIEKGHVLEGKSMEGKILVAHSGKGSSVVQMDGLFKIEKKGKGPAGVILRNPDPVFVTALLVMEIPSVFGVDDAFYDSVQDGEQIVLDTEKGIVTLINSE